jgi:hypothetical protein
MTRMTGGCSYIHIGIFYTFIEKEEDLGQDSVLMKESQGLRQANDSMWRIGTGS